VYLPSVSTCLQGLCTYIRSYLATRALNLAQPVLVVGADIVVHLVTKQLDPIL